METLIRFNDIIAVQKSLLEVNAMRVSYQEPKSETDMPQLILHIKKKEIDIHKFEKIEADIVGKIIQKMYECSEKIKLEKVCNLVSAIISSSNQIAIKTKRGCGNFAIFSERFYELMKKESQYSYLYSQNFKNYLSPHLKDGILVGYRGKEKLDNGLVMCINGNDFQIVDIEGSQKYYMHIGE